MTQSVSRTFWAGTLAEVSQASLLEESGRWPMHFSRLRYQILSGLACDAEILARIGRLHQRLGNLSKAMRAYKTALLIDPKRPRTCNNLALLS